MAFLSIEDSRAITQLFAVLMQREYETWYASSMESSIDKKVKKGGSWAEKL